MSEDGTKNPLFETVSYNKIVCKLQQGATSAYIAHKEINVSFVVQNDQLKETTFIRLLK